MLFYFFISIVFIAELIIAAVIVVYLTKFDKMFNKYNTFLNEVKPLIKDIAETYRKLSEKFLELAPAAAIQVKTIIKDIVYSQLKSLIGGLTFWLVKKEVEKHLT